MTVPAPISSAEIFDRGYRPYDGPRTGSKGAMRSVYIASLQRALGLRRKFRFKIIPILTVAIAYIPAIVFMGLGILLPAEIASEINAEYPEYFGLISIAMTLFTAFVAPELLSTDRNSGLFGLYLASPLNRFSYVLAKGAALVTVLFLVTLFPVLFLLVGYTLGGLGPNGFAETLRLIGKIVASGVAISIFYTVIGMAAASLTKRQGFASAGIVMALVGSTALIGGLTDAADLDQWVQLFSLPLIGFETVAVIFRESGDLSEVADTSKLAAWFVVVAVCSAIVAWSYKRLQVTR